ncbi:hypothetical protein AVEN_18422-1, partial [Araneus ventricosus]
MRTPGVTLRTRGVRVPLGLLEGPVEVRVPLGLLEGQVGVHVPLELLEGPVWVYVTLGLLEGPVGVRVPPGKPEIRDNLGKNVQGVIRTYNEGDSLYLICESQGGKPPPALSWWRGPALIDDTFEVVTSSFLVRNELQLEALTRRDLMAELTCQASNNNVSAPVKSSVSLDLN